MKRHLKPLALALLLSLLSMSTARAGFKEELLQGLHDNWKAAASVLTAAGIVYITYRIHNSMSLPNAENTTLLQPDNTLSPEPIAQRPLEAEGAIPTSVVVSASETSTLIASSSASSSSTSSSAPARYVNHEREIPRAASLEFRNPFLQAIAIGDIASVIAMIETGQASLDIQEHGMNALALAAATDNEAMTSIILNYQDQRGSMNTISEDRLEENSSVRAPIPVDPTPHIMISQHELYEQKQRDLEQETNLAVALSFLDTAQALTRAQQLLNEGTDINVCDREGNSAFMLAVRKGLVNIVVRLLALDVDPSYVNPRTGENALLYALRNRADRLDYIHRDNQTRAINYLVETLDRDTLNSMITQLGITGNACMMAAELGEMELLETIYKINPVLITSTDKEKRTPLHYARSEKTACWLIEKGAHSAAVDKYGRTPLEIALHNKMPGVIIKALKQGVSLDDTLYQKLMLSAASNKYKEVVEALILSRTPATSAPARDAVLKQVSLGSGSYLHKLVCLSPELYNDANFVWRLARHEHKQDNALVKAVQTNDVAKIQAIMGQDVNAPSVWGLTPLMIATILEHTKCMKALLSKKASLDVEIHGKTVQDLLNLLLENGSLTAASEVYDLLLDQAEALKRNAEAANQEALRLRRLQHFGN